MASLAGKVALITGASSGIGAATAILFAKHGVRLSLTGRNMDNLNKTKNDCLQVNNKDQPFLLTGDLTKESDVCNIMEKTIEKFGQLDVLVNNAGMLQVGGIEQVSLEQMDLLYKTNVRSVLQLMTLAVPHLVKTEGSVVNVSSVNGMRAFPNLLAYNVSKAAVDHLTRCAALDLAPKKVRVNAVNPGVIVTELQRRGGLDDIAYAKFLERTKETHALGRPGEPIEVARVIAFLASSDSSFITGATITVDGGRHVMCPR
ncbi:PREDICTED: 3-oxoacyl-[acyl-carrier-protein] reductase FabG-like [Priapulus caudatus]|uniref:3-oxoacyl-[acyl-carrier-protein] reductase FabG-like n=1 Tax=Priapulus caudatus TaxID=37621 RepID=A0ABM1E842_PRICU|nr:PREDICTED: 3-oxoacyl-[acyl-carrier-protein] reductase FabG-like [Priapulus caudatus]XP_014668363.1 PREDICTED: 3-oxoacyl-[acyl-carrier-protein] reductase FabG-like [Priapulus caudatus]